MTEPSEAAKAKACELLNEAVGHGTVWKPEFIDPSYNKVGPAFATFIQQVSDAAKAVVGHHCPTHPDRKILAPFILPDPVDPLRLLMNDLGYVGERHTATFRAALAKRGLKIVEQHHAKD